MTRPIRLSLSAVDGTAACRPIRGCACQVLVPSGDVIRSGDFSTIVFLLTGLNDVSIRICSDPSADERTVLIARDRVPRRAALTLAIRREHSGVGSLLLAVSLPQLDNQGDR